MQFLFFLGLKHPQQTHPSICLLVSSSRWECAYTEKTFQTFREIRDTHSGWDHRNFQRGLSDPGREKKTHMHIPPVISDVYTRTPPWAPRGACTCSGGTLTQDKMSKQGKNIKKKKEEETFAGEIHHRKRGSGGFEDEDGAEIAWASHCYTGNRGRIVGLSTKHTCNQVA